MFAAAAVTSMMTTALFFAPGMHLGSSLEIGRDGSRLCPAYPAVQGRQASGAATPPAFPNL
jgi:hypothetical protein